MKRIILTAILAVLPGLLAGEIIYLKDGQVVQGTIIREKKKSMLVRTKYQTKWVQRDHVLRILYGERDMEKIFILKKDGSILKGFMTDQDSVNVTFRTAPDSAEEILIPKSEISQMSGEEIVPLKPGISLRGGLYYPVNSGGSDLSPAPIILAGYGINFQWLGDARLMIEAGYARCESASSEKLAFQVIPLTAGVLYSMPFPGAGNILGGGLRLVPRLSVGISVVDMDDGEGTRLRGYDFTAHGGAGAVYEMNRSFSLGLWLEYFLLYEKSAMMHGAVVGLGAQYLL